MLKAWISRWGPALLMMALIFGMSSRAADELPNFGGFDYFVKKSGHAFGYGLLALAYWRLLGMDPRRGWIAWLMALCYSATDEYHQSFVPGRHPAVTDVLVFDNLGAMLAVLWWGRIQNKAG